MSRAATRGCRPTRRPPTAMKAQVLEAKLNWLPQGTLLSLLAPSPKQECFNIWGVRSESQCVTHLVARGQSQHAVVEPRLHPHRGAADSAGVGLRQDLGRHRGSQGRRLTVGAEGGRLARRSRSQHPQGLLWSQAGARGARHARRGRALHRGRPEAHRQGSRPRGRAARRSPTSCASRRSTPISTRGCWRPRSCRRWRATACARSSGRTRRRTSTSTTIRSSRPTSSIARSPTTRTWRGPGDPR